MWRFENQSIPTSEWMTFPDFGWPLYLTLSVSGLLFPERVDRFPKWLTQFLVKGGKSKPSHWKTDENHGESGKIRAPWLWRLEMQSLHTCNYWKLGRKALHVKAWMFFLRIKKRIGNSNRWGSEVICNVLYMGAAQMSSAWSFFTQRDRLSGDKWMQWRGRGNGNEQTRIALFCRRQDCRKA